MPTEQINLSLKAVREHHVVRVEDRNTFAARFGQQPVASLRYSLILLIEHSNPTVGEGPENQVRTVGASIVHRQELEVLIRLL